MGNCTSCGREAKLTDCGGCTDASYCSKACETWDWIDHREVCKNPQPQPGPLAIQLFELQPEDFVRHSSLPPWAHPNYRPKHKDYNVPARPIFMNNETVHIFEKNPPSNKEMPLNPLIYHGIVGNPNIVEASELFRFLVRLPNHDKDLAAVARSRSVDEPGTYTKSMMAAVEHLAVGKNRRSWTCVCCPKAAVTFINTPTFHPEKAGEDGYKMFAMVWDLILPFCGSSDCAKGLLPLVKKYKEDSNGRKELDEVYASQQEGCMPFWREQNREREVQKMMKRGGICSCGNWECEEDKPLCNRAPAEAEVDKGSNGYGEF
ncbi:hypothetical protein BJ508DRAFT_362754 [Ascobolus immersus RN42]|uniref:MYND-type domain-containing protein n=1 Tax=Ascobolus immersus RN42 TaxID=1160509 RepID=A0A3N4I456_ASCIM|nr:hypothetical protein BJ508DRAFT_362754 [Ascobolus immersus RN42]